ncbi:MAG: Clp protease N-terminal domain-containing protein [Gemmatimonadales bacterium]
MPPELPFTNRVARLLELADEEAASRGHPDKTPEHVLLALLRDAEGIGASVIGRLQGGDLDGLYRQLEGLLAGTDPGRKAAPPRVSWLLESASAEAVKLRHRVLGSEHLVLALIREPESTAARALADRGIRYADAVAELRRILGMPAGGPATNAP